MAAGNLILYAKNKNQLKLSDLASANLRLALVASSYTPNVTVTGHSVFADVSAYELPTAQGYTAGGAAITGVVAATAGADGYKLSSSVADTVWGSTGAGIPTWKYGVLYYLGTLWGMTNPLIGYFEGNSGSVVPLTSSGNNLTLTCPAAGWFDLV